MQNKTVVKVTQSELISSWYILEFLNTFQQKYAIPLNLWSRLVLKYKLATRLLQQLDDVQELQPDTYAIWLFEYLQGIGVLNETAEILDTTIQ